MALFLMILLGVVLLAILGVLGAGMVGVVRGGDGRRSNALMRARVMLQGAALFLVVLILLFRR